MITELCFEGQNCSISNQSEEVAEIVLSVMSSQIKFLPIIHYCVETAAMLKDNVNTVENNFLL